MPNLRKLRQRRDITNIPAARRPIKREAYELPQEPLGRAMDPAFETLAQQELEERAMPAERMPGPSTILERVVYKELWDLGYRPPDLDFQSSMLGARFSYQFGRQVADFAIHSLGIVIEVQGEYWHGGAEQRNRDAERELQLRAVPRDPPWRVYYLEESVIRNRTELWLWLLDHVVFGGPREEWRASAAVDPQSTRPTMPVFAEEQPGGVPGIPGETPVTVDFSNLNPTNHVINGGFDHDSTRGWTTDAGVTATVVNGKLQLNATVADSGVYQTISNLEPSGTYYLAVTVEAGGNSARWYTTGGLVNPDKTVSSTSETVSTALCQASAVGTLTIHLVAHTTGVNITFDDVILVRGNHAWAWGVHPHADTVDGYHADTSGLDGHVIATDDSGNATISGKLTVPLIDTASGNLELTPAGDLIFDPVGNDLLPETNYDLNLGAINKKYLTLHAAELWVETLVAQNTIATIGGRILVGPTTTLTRDLAAADTTIYTKHNEMAVGDRSYLEANAKVEFIAVTGGPTLQGAGDYAYTVTRDLDGTGANDWYAGDAVFNTGTTGEGFIDLYSLHGVKSSTQYGPSIVGNVRNSATYNDWTEHWAIGNLNGVYGYGTTTYGAAFGKYANNQSFLTADATNGIRILKRAADANTVLGQWAVDGTITIGQVAASQSNIVISAGAIQLRNNMTEKIVLDSGGNISLTGDLAVGTSGSIRSGATAVLTGNGYWLDYNAGTPRFRVGTVSASALVKGVYWDGSKLTARGTIYIDDGSQFGAGNLMWDSSFELNKNTYSTTLCDAVVATTNHDGLASPLSTYVLRIYNLGAYAYGDASAYILQDIPVAAGQQITVSFWATKGGSITGNSCYIRWNDGTHVLLGPGNMWDLVSQTTWTNLHYTFTVPAGITSMRLRFGTINTGGWWLAIDHIMVSYGDVPMGWAPGLWGGVIVDGASVLVGTPGGQRVELLSSGLFGYDSVPAASWGFSNANGVSFGGATLDVGDVLIGSATGNGLRWDQSAGTLSVKGTITVVSGSGIGSFSDANLDNIADGSTYGRINKTIIGGGYIQVGSGTKDSTLNGWMIDNTEIVGQANGVDQVVLDTTGAIKAGGGSHLLNKDGFTIREAGDTYLYRYYDINNHLVSDDYVLIDESTPPAKYIYRDIIVNDDYYTAGGFRFCVNHGGTPEIKLELKTFSPSRLTLNADVFAIYGGALNVGMTGIYGSAGDIYASGGLNVGTATGAGTGCGFLSKALNVGKFIANEGEGNISAVGSDAMLLIVRRDLTAKPVSWATGDRWAVYAPGNTRLSFYTDTTGDLLSLMSAGRVLIGTTTDDGVNRLQVNGSGSFSSYLDANYLFITDGITAPSAVSGHVAIYVDSSTGDLMCKFSDGVTKTLATDT